MVLLLLILGFRNIDASVSLHQQFLSFVSAFCDNTGSSGISVALQPVLILNQCVLGLVSQQIGVQEINTVIIVDMLCTTSVMMNRRFYVLMHRCVNCRNNLATNDLHLVL